MALGIASDGPRKVQIISTGTAHAYGAVVQLLPVQSPEDVVIGGGERDVFRVQTPDLNNNDRGQAMGIIGVVTSEQGLPATAGSRGSAAVGGGAVRALIATGGLTAANAGATATGVSLWDELMCVSGHQRFVKWNRTRLAQTASTFTLTASSVVMSIFGSASASGLGGQVNITNAVTATAVSRAYQNIDTLRVHLNSLQRTVSRLDAGYDDNRTDISSAHAAYHALRADVGSMFDVQTRVRAIYCGSANLTAGVTNQSGDVLLLNPRI